MTEASCPTLELTFLSTTNVVSRGLIDPCNQVNKPAEDITATAGSYALSGYSFSFESEGIAVNSQAALVIRTLFASTRIGIERVGGGNLPVQGKYITSEAKTPSGVSKKVQLFQSYPQIPAEFFVTSF